MLALTFFGTSIHKRFLAFFLLKGRDLNLMRKNLSLSLRISHLRELITVLFLGPFIFSSIILNRLSY